MSVEVLQRLMRADPQELRHRATAAARHARDRVRLTLRPAKWDRAAIRRALRPEFVNQCGLQAAVDRGDWHAAHAIIRNYFSQRRGCFPPALQSIDETRRAIVERFPAAAGQARRTAEQLLNGTIDVLGYRGLEIRDGRSGIIDWHLDPVHRKRPPLRFWTNVPYLDPACGDHKVIWEINRHQHWLALGRAAWLTGDERYPAEIVRQLESWLPQNPPLIGVNWSSMLELAFRATSWVWALGFCTGMPEPDTVVEPWTVDLLVGLDTQLEHVRRNLSRYFSPNTHLLGEALGLYVVGQSVPELANAERWAKVGRAVLLQERTQQINADGGHAELSPHYHRYALDFYLLALGVARVANDAAETAFEETARVLARYMRAICDDRGRMPLIGDDDGGQTFPICGGAPWDAAPSLACAAALLNEPQLAIEHLAEEAVWIAGPRARISRILPSPGCGRAAPRLTAVTFPNTGYHVARTSEGDHLVFDAGAHGFLNGGHAHADALQLVFTSRGRPLLVDPGTSTYTMDHEVRDRFRSTRMHNTLIVDGRDQSMPAGPFHWETRTDAYTWFVGTAPKGAWFEAQHDAYAPLIHRRGVLLLDDGMCVVLDHVLGNDGSRHEATLNWHLASGWTADTTADGIVRLASPDGGVRHMATTAEVARVRDDAEGLGWCAPIYGQLEPATTISATASGASPITIATVIVPEHARPHLLMRVVAGDRGIGTVLDISSQSAKRQLVSWTELSGPPQPQLPEWRVDGLTSCARVAVIDRSTTDLAVICAFGGEVLDVAPSVQAEAR